MAGENGTDGARWVIALKKKPRVGGGIIGTPDTKKSALHYGLAVKY